MSRPGTAFTAVSASSTKTAFSKAPVYTEEEQKARREAALEIVQREGLPDTVQKIRVGTDAEKEEAVKTLSFLATHDAQCATFIAACGAIQVLIPLLSAKDGIGDEDATFDLKEQTVKCLRDLCIGDRCNQRPVAECGAIPPLLKILTEQNHPWSIREAAAEAIAILAYELSGGPAQEIIMENQGITKLLAVFREKECTPDAKYFCAKGMRFMAAHKPAALEMRALGILKAREQNPDTDIIMPGLDGGLV